MSISPAHRLGSHYRLRPTILDVDWKYALCRPSPRSQAFTQPATAGWRAQNGPTDPSHCRDCHTIADDSFGPIQTELGNAGINLHSLWSESLRTETRMRVQERWMLRAAAEQNDLATTWHADVLFELQPAWPLRLDGHRAMQSQQLDAPFQGYTRLRLGVCRGPHLGLSNPKLSSYCNCPQRSSHTFQYGVFYCFFEIG